VHASATTIIYTNGVIYRKKDISIIIIITEDVDRTSIVVREHQIFRDKYCFTVIVGNYLKDINSDWLSMCVHIIAYITICNM